MVVTDFLTKPDVQAGLALLVLSVLLVAGFYLVSIFRDYAAEDRDNTQEVLSNLQEMHFKGDISDEEFRTIQSTTHQHSAETASVEDFPLGDQSTST
ncbi:MAG: hypothetical protein OSA98_02880 [Rubripirellula sp.]|nr:hypothetical protein [Rubripirellula sp.]